MHFDSNQVRVYEENTKVLLSTMAEGSGNKSCGHSNRVYAVKFKPNDLNVLISGGWDNTLQVAFFSFSFCLPFFVLTSTLQIWDIRAGQSVRSIYGPHICGSFISFSSMLVCFV